MAQFDKILQHFILMELQAHSFVQNCQLKSLAAQMNLLLEGLNPHSNLCRHSSGQSIFYNYMQYQLKQKCYVFFENTPFAKTSYCRTRFVSISTLGFFVFF